MIACLLALCLCGAPASAQDPGAAPSSATPSGAATGDTTPGATTPSSASAPTPAAGSGQSTPPSSPIGAIEPVTPPLSPAITALSLECAVPQSEIAGNAPLDNTMSKLATRKKLVILAIGSAATRGNTGAGMHVRPPSRLESIFEKMWKGVDIEIINRGVSGEIAAATARRLINEAATIKPDLVLWQLGTNDAVSRVPIPEFEETVRSTVRRLRANKIDVVLVGLQYTPRFARDDHYFAVRDALNRLAEQEKLLYVRRYRAMEYIARAKSNQKLLADDNFAIEELGYRCMAEHIAQAMIANIFLRRPVPKVDRKS